MAIYNTPDGRQVVGSVESGNDYHGFNGKRDIIIQLTADGATTDGLNALEYLKAYAIEQNKQNKPIFPNGTRVFISANGYTKAVEADDIVIDGDNITIGGIKWDGSAWDYSEAGQTGAALPPVTDADDGKVLTANSGVWGAQEPIGKKFIVTLTPTSPDYSGTMDKTVAEINSAYEAGQQIVFRVMLSATQYMDVDCTARWFSGSTYPSFNGFILSSDNGGILIFAFTGASDDGTITTYGADIYTLTPPT